MMYMKVWRTQSNYVITQLLGGRSNLFIPSHGYANKRQLIEKIYAKKTKM